MKHSNKSQLFHGIDKSQSWIDETGMTTIMMAFTENQDKAEYMVQLLPPIVEHDIGMECAQEWFTPGTYHRANEIQYDKESNTFVLPDDKMMDYLLADKLQGNTIELEGIPDPEAFEAAAKPRGSGQSFISFGYALGKTTKELKNPQTPSNDLMLTPTDTSRLTEIAQLNEEQQMMISQLQAEVSKLHLKFLRKPPGGTRTPGDTGTPDNTGNTTMPKDSESDGHLSEEDDAAASVGSSKIA
jgi:hypothetical protein